MDGRNFDLKEEIRDYWSNRSRTFDLAFGHRIPAGPEADAWQRAIRDLLGAAPQRVLELVLQAVRQGSSLIDRENFRPNHPSIFQYTSQLAFGYIPHT